MKSTPLRSIALVITSAGVLAACSDGIDSPGAEPGGTGMNEVVNGGGVVPPAGMTPVTPPITRIDEGQPTGTPVTPGTAQPPPGTNGNTGGGPGPVITPSTRVDTEPNNCTIPPVPSNPVGYGANTTGGGNATAVTVSSFAEAEAALASYRAAFKEGTGSSLVLRYNGSFDFSSITDVCAQHTKEPQVLQIKEMENVTFEGAPGSSANFGLHINRAKNVIVRNMTMGLLPGGDGSDAITVEGNNTNGDVENVWIDHNELFSSTKEDCPGAGDTEFDGLIDIKKGARFITVSYNYLHDHQKTGLMGFSDSDDTERYVTIHHNRYENIVSRTPLHRFGYIHIFNNFFGNITSTGINVRMGGVALIESNFFENAQNPITSRYSGEAGFWDLRNNHVGPGITWSLSDDTFANADTWESTTTFPDSELTYAYTPDQAGCVKQIVRATAGAIL